MIQRAQTIYLGLAFICMVLLLVFPIFSVEVSAEGASTTAVFGAYGVIGEAESNEFPVYIVIIILALLSAAGILLYKKRPRQLLICRLNLILHLLFTAGVYLFYYFGKAFVSNGITVEGVNAEVIFGMETGFFLMIPALAFIWLAIRGIKRDEKLVKSLDRLR
jgi:hypothetical protein